MFHGAWGPKTVAQQLVLCGTGQVWSWSVETIEAGSYGVRIAGRAGFVLRVRNKARKAARVVGIISWR